jgi:hypothetical protein
MVANRALSPDSKLGMVEWIEKDVALGNEAFGLGRAPATRAIVRGSMIDELGMPYQTLINLYLRDCAATGKRLSISWEPAA